MSQGGVISQWGKRTGGVCCFHFGPIDQALIVVLIKGGGGYQGIGSFNASREFSITASNMTEGLLRSGSSHQWAVTSCVTIKYL